MGVQSKLLQVFLVKIFENTPSKQLANWHIRMNH